MAHQSSWRVDQDAHKGRLLRANALIPKGTTVLIEQPFAQVVFHRHKRHFCARCLAKADPDLCCDDCGQVVFCSEECMERMQPVHAKECEALEEVELIAKKTGIDLDLLRLLVRGLCTRALELEASPEYDEACGEQLDDGVIVNARGEIACSYRKVSQMCHVLKQLDDSWKASVHNAIGLVIELLPEECQQDGWEEDALVMAAQVNENSYSLDAWKDHQVVASVAIFPICGLMNHSCWANCAWFNDGTGKIQVCALRDIQPDEEITLSYIDACNPRHERRQELLRTKHFLCKCERCAQPFHESVDRYLESFECPVCPNGLLYCQQSLGALKDKDQAACEGCGHSLAAKRIAMASARDRETLARAKKHLEQRNYQRVCELLEPLVFKEQSAPSNDQVLQLGIGNNIRIAALKALGEAYSKNLNDNVLDAYKCRTSHLKDVLRVFPGNHLQVAWAWYDRAEALYALMVLTPTGLLIENPRPEQPREMEMPPADSLWHEMVECYTNSKRAFGFWLPNPHPLRVVIDQRLATIAKLKDCM